MNFLHFRKERKLFSIQVFESDFRKGMKCLLVPGLRNRPHIYAEMFEDLEVWIHEFTEEDMIEFFRNNGLSRFIDGLVHCSIFGLHKQISIPHLLASLHTVSYVQTDKGSIRLAPEDFANSIAFEWSRRKPK